MNGFSHKLPRNKRNLQKPTETVQRLTEQAPARLLWWGRLGAAAMLASGGSGLWLAYLSWQQGTIPFGVRALFSLSTTLGVYAVSRALQVSDTRLLHGSAHWSDVSDVGRAGLIKLGKNHSLPPVAFFLGTQGGQMVALPGTVARQHGIIVGGTGTGKTRGFFLPNAAFSRSESLLCTDPKGELWRHTSGFHQKATRYAPTEPEQSSGFNWVPLCREARYAELCARTLIESGEDGPRRAEAIWIEAETAFLSALFAHAATLPQPTPLTAYRLFAWQKQETLLQQLRESASEVAREQAMVFEQTQERMRGSIVPAVAAKLQFLRDPSVARFTSSDIDAPNFGRLRQKPEAVYWCLQEHDMVRLRPLTSLFFTLVMEQIARAAPPDCPDAVPVRALLDEFANIGTLPQFDTTVALSRSRGLSLWLGLQSLSQLEDRYGKASAQTILANCATKIILPGLDIDSAEYVSRTLGQATVVTERRAWSLRHLFGRTGSVSYRQTEAARPLLTPDEVRRMGTREMLVVSTNRAPVLLHRYIYTLAPETAAATRLASAQAAPLSMNDLVARIKSNNQPPPPFPDELAPLPEPTEVSGKQAAVTPKKGGKQLAFQIRRLPRAAQCIRISKPTPLESPTPSPLDSVPARLKEKSDPQS